MNTENKEALAGVQAELAAGMVRIGDKLALLDELVMRVAPLGRSASICGAWS